MRLHFSSLLKAYAIACLAGVAVDIAIMELLVTGGLEPHVARLVSILPATLVTYLLHSRYTFAAYKDVRTAQGKPVPYGALALASIVLNYAIFTRVLHIPEPPVGLGMRATAILLGSFAAYGANWALLQSLLEKAKPASGTDTDSGVSIRSIVATGGLRRAAIWIAALFMIFDSPRLLHQLHGIMMYPDILVPLQPADPDVWLRLTQVRQWILTGFSDGIFGSGFFDHHVAHTNAPLGGISTPWTRPVDFIVAGFAQLAPHSISLTQRLLLAALWMPAALTALNLYFLNRAASLHNRLSSAAGITVLLFMLSDFYYLAPGNSDHHGLLSVLWCGAAWLLLAEKLPLLLGAFLGLSIWISPEALVTTAFIFAVMGAESMLYPEKMRRLFFAALAAAAVCGIALFVEMPAADILARRTYDTLSLVQEFLLILTALATGVLTASFKRLTSLQTRIAAAAVAGAGILLGEYLFFPGFFSGPMRDVDGIVFSKMLPRISEAKPLFIQRPFIILQTLMWAALAIAILVGILRRKRRIATQRHAIILLALLLATLGLTLVQTRWQYYMQPIAVLALASFLPVVSMGAGQSALGFIRGMPRWARSYTLCWMVYLTAMLCIKLCTPSAIPPNAYCYTQISWLLQSRQLEAALGPEPVIMLLPRDNGGEVQFFTPYRILASNYHREGAGLEDMMAIENAPTAEAALPLLQKRKVGAIFTCPTIYSEDSWLRTLDTNPPAWLTPVTIPKFMRIKGGKPLLFTLPRNP